MTFKVISCQRIATPYIFSFTHVTTLKEKCTDSIKGKTCIQKQFTILVVVINDAIKGSEMTLHLHTLGEHVWMNMLHVFQSYSFAMSMVLRKHDWKRKRMYLYR
jgi:hypothetical protein